MMNTSKLAALLAMAISVASCTSSRSQPTETAATSTLQADQATFKSPNDAATALVEAAAKYDIPTLVRILGRDGEELVASADRVADKNRAETFVAKAHEKMKVVQDAPGRATVVVGEQDWPLPIPIVA